MVGLFSFPISPNSWDAGGQPVSGLSHRLKNHNTGFRNYSSEINLDANVINKWEYVQPCKYWIVFGYYLNLIFLLFEINAPAITIATTTNAI